MSTDPILRGLREQPFYAGQVYRIESVPPEAASIYSTASVLNRLAQGGLSKDAQETLGDLMGYMGMATVYEHQEKVLTRVLRGQDVVLAAPPGTGRAVVVGLSALYRALHQRQTVLVLVPSERTLLHRSAFLKRIVSDMGVEYACEVASLAAISEETRAFPDVLLATPVMLMKLIEGSLIAPFSHDFLRALGLVILEDVHEYSGTFGRHVEKLLRCLQIERRTWRDDPWQILATGLEYRNLLDLVSVLSGKVLDRDPLITTVQAGVAAKELVFWNTPLVLNEGGEKYIRKDYVSDVRDLISYLARQGMSSLGESTHRFVVLVDRSISMEGEPWKMLRDTLVDDLPRLVDARDEISLRPFDTELRRSVISGKRAKIEEDGSLANLVSGGLDGEAPEKRHDGTEIGVAMLKALSEETSDLGSVRSIVLFLYSDGCDQIDPETAHKIRAKFEELAAVGVTVHLIYVALGLDPDPSVRSLVMSCNGKFVQTGYEGKDSIRPSALWTSASEQDRPVFVLAYDDSLTPDDIQLASLTDPRRPVIFRNRLGFPQWEGNVTSPREPSLSSAKYVVVVGWEASPAMMRHIFQRLGNHDAVVFLVGTPKAGIQAFLRQWPGDKCIEDVISLGADTPEIAVAMARSFSRIRTIGGADLSCLIGSQSQNQDAVKTTVRLLSQSSADGRPQSVFDHLLIARKSVTVSRLGVNQSAVGLDSLEVFRLLLPGGDIVVNGRRLSIGWNSEQGYFVEGNSSRPMFAFARANGRWSLSDNNTRGLVVNRFGYRLCQEQIRVRLDLESVDCYQGARFDERPDKIATERSHTFATNALILEPVGVAPKDMAAILSGTENLLWNYLSPLLKGDPRSLLALADVDSQRIAVFEIADGPTDLPGLLASNDYALLGTALRTGFMALMDCPCADQAAVKDQTVKPLENADPGCPWCLQAPSKVAGLGPDMLCKQAVLKHLGNAKIIPGYPLSERLRHKYQVFDDNRRLTGDVEGGSVCHKILAVLKAKLGIEICCNDQASVAFAHDSELNTLKEALGWYDSGTNKIRIRAAREFQVLDMLAHEYGHNWQSREPLPEISPASLPASRHYDLENVENPKNLPFAGLLFAEGSAVWIESHAMDFFAYRSQLDERGVGAEEPGCFEYWQGMRVMKYIEEKYGMKAVLVFLRSGDIYQATTGQGKKREDIRDLNHLYEVSQLKGFLVNSGRDASNQGLVPLFGSVDLNRPENLIRVSAWLKFRDQCLEFSEIPPRGKNDSGAPETNAEYMQRMEVAGCLSGAVSIRTLLTIPLFRDNGVAKVLTENDLGDHVGSESAWDISVFLACHLKSSAQKSTAARLNPIISWLKETLGSHLGKV